MIRKLLSISQFIKDHDCIFEFTLIGFSVVSRPIGRVIARGSRHVGFYVLEQVKEAALFSRQVDATEEIWFKRLGHCSSQVLERLQKDELCNDPSQ